MERTLVLVKPDGVQRGLIGEVISRFERKGLKVVALKLLMLSADRAHRHYGIHKGKPFYDGLIAFITSGPVVALVLDGPDAIRLSRSIVGATRPADAAPGSIRGDLALTTGMNLVHASDAPETAAFEVDTFFEPAEIVPYDLTLKPWLA